MVHAWSTIWALQTFTVSFRPRLSCLQGIVHSPSLEALAAAAEQAEQAGIVPGVGDPLRGRQLGRVALLKKEFGFIRQARWLGRKQEVLGSRTGEQSGNPAVRERPPLPPHPVLSLCTHPCADGAPRRHVLPLLPAGGLGPRRRQGGRRRGVHNPARPQRPQQAVGGAGQLGCWWLGHGAVQHGWLVVLGAGGWVCGRRTHAGLFGSWVVPQLMP